MQQITTVLQITRNPLHKMSKTRSLTHLELTSFYFFNSFASLTCLVPSSCYLERYIVQFTQRPIHIFLEKFAMISA
jgi:hypothetical protein